MAAVSFEPGKKKLHRMKRMIRMLMEKRGDFQ
jgi:hypothetical protein